MMGNSGIVILYIFLFEIGVHGVTPTILFPFPSSSPSLLLPSLSPCLHSPGRDTWVPKKGVRGFSAITMTLRLTHPPLCLRMAFKDFKTHFDKVEICNLTPDALEDNALHRWEVTIHQGSWVRGSTAGGCRNFLGRWPLCPSLSYSHIQSVWGHGRGSVRGAG